DDLLAFFRISLDRLLVYQLVEFGVAVPGIVSRRTAEVILVVHLVRVVDAALRRHRTDRIVLTQEKPFRASCCTPERHFDCSRGIHWYLREDRRHLSPNI